MHLHYRNVNEAFYEMVRGIYLGTIPVKRQDSRNGPVLRIPEPVTVTYARPTERVLFHETRDCNPFFHLFESMWMLAGSELVEPVAYYNRRMRDYSDDGETFHGAYGFRWRQQFGYDQVAYIAQELKRNPESRRCVLQIWDATVENPSVPESKRHDLWTACNGGKDVPCLEGRTRFRSPEGDVSIMELARRFSNDSKYRFPVFTVDPISGHQKLTWMDKAWKSGTKRLLRVTFDDGSYVDATANHRFFVKKLALGYNGKNVKRPRSVVETRVDELRVGDRLLATGAHQDRRGYIHFKRNVFANTAYRNLQKVHRKYIELAEGCKLSVDEDVHHIDGDVSNNRLANLERLDHGVHASIGKFGGDNPHCKMSSLDRKKRGRKHSQSMKSRWSVMDEKTRQAFAKRRSLRSASDIKLMSEFNSRFSNHRVISIEPIGRSDVYDFTVNDGHNAVLSNGVVCHNCNTQAYFCVMDGALDMTVCNRSNDMVWGMLGANVVHFSYLQEYIACLVGIPVGRYHQVTNNLHVYEANWRPLEWMAYRDSVLCAKPCEIPLVSNQTQFDYEVSFIARNCVAAVEYTEPYLRNVVVPMCMAFKFHKSRDYEVAHSYVDMVEDEQWHTAGKAWLRRREENWRRKNGIDNPYLARELDRQAEASTDQG